MAKPNYTVVITAHQGAAATMADSRLVLHLNTASDHAAVTTVSVTNSSGEGVTPANFPQVDLVAVVEAMINTVLPYRNEMRPVLKTASAGRTYEPRTVDSSDEIGSPVYDKVPQGEAHATLQNSKSLTGTRAYRKMPNPDELRRKLEETGTVTGLARHYKVPRHTAQGWVSRLRKMDNGGAHA